MRSTSTTRKSQNMRSTSTTRSARRRSTPVGQRRWVHCSNPHAPIRGWTLGSASFDT
jgi:hypothetical protein